MNRLLFIIIVAIAISGCASSKKTALTGEATTISNEGRDGLSYETAIIVPDIDSEYEWIRRTYPGSKVQMQALSREKGKFYDVLTATLADGSNKKFYFDINSFFGKGFK